MEVVLRALKEFYFALENCSSILSEYSTFLLLNIWVRQFGDLLYRLHVGA